MPTRLTEARIRKLSLPGVHGDGGRGSYGLQLRVHRAKGGHLTKSFRQAVRIDGKVTCIGLGSWPYTSLDQARAQCITNIIKIRQGIDPRKKKQKKIEPFVVETPVVVVPTFAECGQRVIELRRKSWKSSTTESKWQTDVTGFPFSNQRVDEIQKADVLAYLSPIWTSRPAYGRRKFSVVRAVMRWAVAAGHLSADPTVSLTSVLPKLNGGVRHHRALPHGEVGAALDKVDEYSSKPSTRRECGLLLRFVALTAVRSGEASGATWDEIDMGEAVWTIPASRTKVGKEHRVPLSSGARCVLSEAKALNGDTGIIFPARTAGRIRAGSTGAMMKSAGVDAVPHGFRSSFRSWCAETGVAREVAERALGHVEKSQVVRAYMRSDLLEKRRATMQAWSDYLLHAQAR